MKIDFKEIARELGLNSQEYCEEIATCVMDIAIQHFKEKPVVPFEFKATDASTGKIYKLMVKVE